MDDNTLLWKLGGRKFLLSVLIVVVTSLLVYFRHISDGVYSAVIIATIGAYIAGNVMQKASETKGS